LDPHSIPAARLKACTTIQFSKTGARRGKRKQYRSTLILSIQIRILSPIRSTDRDFRPAYIANSAVAWRCSRNSASRKSLLTPLGGVKIHARRDRHQTRSRKHRPVSPHRRKKAQHIRREH